MQLLNFTIVIQALNFFIAFFIIKYFLLKQAFAQIKAEDILQETLVATVQEHQLVVAHKEQELIKEWQEMREHFANHAPLAKPESIITRKFPGLTIESFDRQEIKEAQDIVTNTLITKINHVI